MHDTKYILTMDDITGEEYYLGDQRSELRYNQDMETWNLTTYGEPGKFITSQAHRRSLLIGRQQWTLHNEPKCSPNVEYKLEMAITACRQSEFNCRNGTCIDMIQRCNQWKDCTDGSDEMDCRIVVIPSGYQKDKPAPPRDKNSAKNSVMISMKLESIQSISETERSIALLFNLEMQWWDPRLTFENLKNTTELNILTGEENKMIWVPIIIFNNTQNKLKTLNDDHTVVFILREGHFSNSEITDLDNIEIFAGAENKITMNRMYNIDFMCEYHLHMYPFDTQTCYITMVLDIRIQLFVNMINGDFMYNGPIDLQKYFVKDTEMQLNENSLRMKVVLGRKLMNQVLTTFLPTGLLIIIIHATNFFKDFFFEAIVSVNLTGMLVLTTIFLSVSSSLPETAYVKMVDIWLLFCILVPFCEVLLHTWMDSLRNDENRQVNLHGEARSAGKKRSLVQVQPRDETLVHRNEEVKVNALRELYDKAQTNETHLQLGIFIGRKLIPGIITMFVIGYWIFGILHYIG